MVSRGRLWRVGGPQVGGKGLGGRGRRGQSRVVTALIADQDEENPVPWLDVPGVIRRVRRVLDLSQRDLARRLGVHHSLIGRWETGERSPSLPVFQQLLVWAGLNLEIHDIGDSGLRLPMRRDPIRDRGDRRYPAHLDVICFLGRTPFPVTQLNARGHAENRCAPQRRRRNEIRRRTGRIPHDHPNLKLFEEELAELRRAHQAVWLARWDRYCDERVARGEPDPRVEQECTCLDACFCEAACLPACPCQCEPGLAAPG